MKEIKKEVNELKTNSNIFRNNFTKSFKNLIMMKIFEELMK